MLDKSGIIGPAAADTLYLHPSVFHEVNQAANQK